MILVPDVEKKKIGVFGLGLTGLSVCDSLVASGAEAFVWDENEAARARTQNTRYAAEHPKSWPWAELSSLVLSPGVPLSHPKPHVIVRKARQEGVEIIGDIELFARAVAARSPAVRPRVIAVTGSNGKSTTTALIGHILNAVGAGAIVGGNIGKPALALPELTAARACVLELSSFQLDLVSSFRANTAILLNISPDHIDRHGDLDGYVRAKRRIFLNQRADDLAIVGVDDVRAQGILAELSAEGRRRVTPITAEGALGAGVYALDGKLYYSTEDAAGVAGDVSGVASLKGRHNWQNAAAALAAVMNEGVSPALAARAMEQFPGLPHRMEVVGRAPGVIFVNDSKATNADAAAKALSSYEAVYWIAGGKPKEGGVESLRPLMGRVRAVYLIGEAAADFERQLSGAARIVQCGALAQAVEAAAADARGSGVKEAVVLLSPACASYDQFRNFEERGEAFRRLARGAVEAMGAAA